MAHYNVTDWKSVSNRISIVTGKKRKIVGFFSPEKRVEKGRQKLTYGGYFSPHNLVNSRISTEHGTRNSIGNNRSEVKLEHIPGISIL